MKLKRFEFGISQTSPEQVEVQARRGDGAVFVRSFPRATDEVLALAEQDFRVNAKQWSFVPPRADSTGLSLVWRSGRRLYVSGEAAITTANLAREEIDLVVSVSLIQAETRRAIEEHQAQHPFAHLEFPILDVLPAQQTDRSARNASQALDAVASALAARSRVVVHCLMGIHRSVSVSAVALTRAGLAPSPRAAFLEIQGHRHIASWIPETIEWLSSLR